MASVKIIDHPIVTTNLTAMRSANTPSFEFRERLRIITRFLTYEATRTLELVPTVVSTPMQDAELPTLACGRISVIPILRAGLGMVDGVLDVIPDAAVGFIGMYRDETTRLPVDYYINLPEDISQSKVFIIDPMLATGGSAVDAVAKVVDAGATDIAFVCLLAAPEGVERLQKAYPDVSIFTASVDEGLNDQAYILPGLGDAGDRIFNNLAAYPGVI